MRMTVNHNKLNHSLIPDFKRQIDKMYDLLPEIRRHLSIDTLAKKKYLSGKEKDLSILKNLISAFLFFEQTKSSFTLSIPSDEPYDSNAESELATKLDGRYDLFLASLLEKRENKIQFPNNINIISWNYDNQVELSYKEFLKEKDEFIDLKINAIHDHFHDDFRPFLYKLNGTCSWQINENKQFPKPADSIGVHQFATLSNIVNP